MEEMERMRNDVTQLTRRVDDYSLRLAAVEAHNNSFENKLDSLKELIDLKLSNMGKSVDSWNKIGFWLLTTIGTGFILATVAWVASGGLRSLS